MTTESLWTAVDDYIDETLVGEDDALRAVRDASVAAGLPAISVSPSQGKWLYVMARAMRASRILEIGTLGGYSAIWLTRALPADGRLITIEADPNHAGVARQNFERAGVAGRIDLHVGTALDVLPQLDGPFDLVFIDADKNNYPLYLEWSIKLCRPGGLIVADNVIRHGALADATSTDAAVQAMRRVMTSLQRDRRATATALQTVGMKGYDGFAIILVND